MGGAREADVHAARHCIDALRATGLDVRLSSMASFRPDGARYDGRGVEPDVVVLPAPEDLVGEGDAQLEAALRLLKRERR